MEKYSNNIFATFSNKNKRTLFILRMYSIHAYIHVISYTFSTILLKTLRTCHLWGSLSSMNFCCFGNDSYYIWSWQLNKQTFFSEQIYSNVIQRAKSLVLSLLVFSSYCWKQPFSLVHILVNMQSPLRKR